MTSLRVGFEGAPVWLARKSFGFPFPVILRENVKKILRARQTRNRCILRGNGKAQPGKRVKMAGKTRSLGQSRRSRLT